MKLGWRWDHQLVQQWVWNWRRRPLKNCILIIFSSFVFVRTIRVYILKDQCDFSYKSQREYWTNLCDWIWIVSRIVDISFLDIDAMLLHLFLPIYTVRTNKKARCFHMNIYQINRYLSDWIKYVKTVYFISTNCDFSHFHVKRLFCLHVNKKFSSKWYIYTISLSLKQLLQFKSK